MHKAGDILQDRYRIERVLGSGGMGGVYLAVHQALDAKVAIKEMTLQIANDDDRTAAIRQFKKEAQMLHLLHHDNLPRVHDFFEHDGKYYLVMDYIKGRTLAQLIASQPLSEEDLHRYNRPLCAVLEYLHKHTPPIIFRDLKPSNIMLADDGTVKLIDFGIAKDFDATTGRGTKTSARGAGTPGFAAPEQYGAGSDVRTDIYALGATLYNLLTRVVPPDSVDIASGGAELAPLLDSRPDVSASTARVIEWMLSINRTQRPSTVEEVSIALGYREQAAFTVLPQRVLDQLDADADRSNPNVTRRREVAPAPPDKPVVNSPPPPAQAPSTLPAAPATAMLAEPTTQPPPRRSLMVPAGVGLLVVAALVITAIRMIPKTMTVHLTSQPPGASVVVNHSPGPVTPCDILDVLADRPLLVELTKPGYEDYNGTLPVEASPAAIKLTPASAYVNVVGTPAAILSIDGRDVDQVNSIQTGVPISAGVAHKLVVHADGYEPYAVTKTVMPGDQPPMVSYTLKQKLGSLAVHGLSGARFLLEDKAYTIGPKGLRLDKLVPKQYHVKVQATGYEDRDDDVVVKPGTVTQFNADLSRVAVAPAPVATVVMAPPATVEVPPPPCTHQPAASTPPPAPSAGVRTLSGEVRPGEALGDIVLGTPADAVIRDYGLAKAASDPSVYGSSAGIVVQVDPEGHVSAATAYGQALTGLRTQFKNPAAEARIRQKTKFVQETTSDGTEKLTVPRKGFACFFNGKELRGIMVFYAQQGPKRQPGQRQQEDSSQPEQSTPHAKRFKGGAGG